VIVLEARNRIGGRIWTATPWGDDLQAEFGAEFIHDSVAARRMTPRRENRRINWGEIGAGSRFVFDRRTLKRGDVRECPKLAMVLDDAWITACKGATGSVRDALRGWLPLARKVAEAEIEGEWAADPTKLSFESVRDDWNGWGRVSR
jgi:hypothetical protein